MRRLRRMTERGRSAVDYTLAGLLFVGGVIAVLTYADPDSSRAVGVLIVGITSASLVFRRTYALVPPITVGLGAIALSFVYAPAPDITSSTVSLIFASYSVAANFDRRESFIGLGIVAATIAGLCIAYTPTDIVFPVGVFAVLPWVVGRALRNNTLLARELAEKAEMLEHAREEDERRAVGAERARVARELHDVLAHNLSVMVIQASAARRVVDKNPDAAVQAADLIQRTGRETLNELRHLFGTVRKGEGEALSGTPGLAHVESLVERARAAGLPVTLDVEGSPPQVPTGVDTTGYRLVQEALTNSLKYGGGAPAEVHLRYEGWDVVIEVLDRGPGPNGHNGRRNISAVDSGGHGLLGMRERVELYGGKLDAGRRRGGGFAVRARLPLGEGALA